MKILSFVLSTALLTSTAAIASASPYDNDGNAKRGDDSSQRDDGSVQVGDGMPDRVTVRDHRTEQNDQNGWNHGRRPAPAPVWTSLASLRVSGRQSVIAVDRKVDTLKLDVSRGQLTIKSAVIVFSDGSRYVAPIDAQMRAGESQVIQIPGAAKRVAKIQLKLARQSKAQITLSAK